MTINDLIDSFDPDAVGEEIYSLIRELYPICRSITGNGFCETLRILQKHIPLKKYEVPSGTKVFDWTIPKEWNIKDAYIKDSKGERIIDFRKSNLHVLNYSIPIHETMSLKELKDHLYTLPEHPDWIPYKTSYYTENWGFCLSHNDLLKMENGEYEVCIDSTLEEGYLTYGELYLEGQEEDEMLISCHSCHPSLANDNLSGVSLAVSLAQQLSSVRRRYSYRFLFIPGTIGAITWLALNGEKIPKIEHGLVLTGLGDSGNVTYKKSRRGNAEIDRAALHVLKHSGRSYDIIDFYPYGYDERQYCSPGFNLAIGRISRTPYGQYPEYHTSADNLKFVKPEYLGGAFRIILEMLYILENNRTYLNLNPKCEPQLGKRGLYGAIGGRKDAAEVQLAMLWVLNMSDGNNCLLEIADKGNMNFSHIENATHLLISHNLVSECK